MFSVLMTIYKNDDVTYLKDAIESILNQTSPADEILIVKDGPLKKETEDMLLNYKGAPFIYLNLDQNVGQSKALELGLLECSNELVARMDSDDISHPTRFEKQLRVFANRPELSVVGAGIIEFDETIEDANNIRVIPTEHEDILQYSKLRSPVNHAAVMFKKKDVLKAGNYVDIFSVADYHLWVRMLAQGSLFYNLQEPLLYVRGGRSMYGRRGGWHYVKQEVTLQLFMLKKNHISIIEFIRNILMRVLGGLAPNFIRTFIYDSFLRQKKANL